MGHLWLPQWDPEKTLAHRPKVIGVKVVSTWRTTFCPFVLSGSVPESCWSVGTVSRTLTKGPQPKPSTANTMRRRRVMWKRFSNVSSVPDRHSGPGCPAAFPGAFSLTVGGTPCGTDMDGGRMEQTVVSTYPKKRSQYCHAASCDLDRPCRLREPDLRSGSPCP